MNATHFNVNKESHLVTLNNVKIQEELPIFSRGDTNRRYKRFSTA